MRIGFLAPLAVPVCQNSGPVDQCQQQQGQQQGQAHGGCQCASSANSPNSSRLSPPLFFSSTLLPSTHSLTHSLKLTPLSLILSFIIFIILIIPSHPSFQPVSPLFTSSHLVLSNHPFSSSYPTALLTLMKSSLIRLRVEYPTSSLPLSIGCPLTLPHSRLPR